jgi:hypothetical protein
MPAYKTNVTVRKDHKVIMRLPDDFPAGEAEVIIMPRPTVVFPHDSAVVFDNFFAPLSHASGS